MSKRFSTFDDYFDAPMDEFPLPARILYKVCVGIVWAFSKVYWHWTCDGVHPFKGVPKGAKGRVVVANHASMLDPAVLVIDACTHGRRLRPLYKSEFGKSSLVSWFFSRVGGIPIKRGVADMKAIRRAVAAIKRGEDIMVFPEGTRIWDPDERPELHGGFSMIAQLSDCAVVPVAIDGTERINPYKKGFPRPARVLIRYGEPIELTDVPGEKRRDKAEAMEKIAMGRVYEMRADLRRERGRA